MHLANITWPEVDKLSRDTPIVIPVAAMEQHGHHLPLFTDTILLGDVCRRVSAEMEERVVFAPLMWLGNSGHHMDFPGTMTAAPRTYLNILVDLLDSFVVHGFRRLLILNGHGGNIVPGQQAIYEVRQKYRHRKDLLLLFSGYWALGEDPAAAHPEIEQKQMMHACEWETSMMLQVAPHLVKGYEDAEPVLHGPAFEPAARGWTTKDRSESGHIGDPRPASAEKGEALLQQFAGDVAGLLERIVKWPGGRWEE